MKNIELIRLLEGITWDLEDIKLGYTLGIEKCDAGLYIDKIEDARLKLCRIIQQLDDSF